MRSYYQDRDVTLYCGDCLEVLPLISDCEIDMVFTSPPYAERRKGAYGGIKSSEYVEWFSPIGIELKRVLADTGSFFLNLKPHTEDGERSLYVFDLVCNLKLSVGFKFVEEYCWTKNPYPGGFKGRFKNAFEPIYHFTKSFPSEIVFNPLACGTPIKPESIARSLGKYCGEPKNGSGMGMNTANIRHLELVRPSNVIHCNNVVNHSSAGIMHPAVFPEGLVEFFVKSFTNAGNVVLDPFAGSGTTGYVAKSLNRKSVLIEKEEKYCEIIASRLSQGVLPFFEDDKNLDFEF